ncbi:MAG: DNA polymerase IV [Sciscionella sp.]
MGRSGDLPRGAAAEFLASGDDPSTWPDDTGCAVLHVDMDAFFASVELRERPELVDRPVVVAAESGRSVVTAANYPARRFGVHSAMPLAKARQLCPQAVVIPPSRERYSEVSRAVMAIFADVTPLVEPLSLDEAYLDVSGALRRLRLTPAQIGARIRQRVFEQQRITCSVGVASVKFIAKVASGMAKPDGMLVVPASRTLRFLHPLPVSALAGVGERTAEQLRRIGLETVGDIACAPQPRLRRVVGAAHAGYLHALALGEDARPVVPDRGEKSVGAETTFDVDRSDREFLLRELLRLAERAGSMLRDKQLLARTVSIKVRYADFTTITRARTLPVASALTREFYRTAATLLTEQAPEGALRLLGVRMEGLIPATSAAKQLTFDEPDHGWAEAEQAADEARHRFGVRAVRPATLVNRESEGFATPKSGQPDGPGSARVL